jgi:hypothetical protein
VWRICYGGARKGGKSYVGRAASLFRRMAYPGSMGLIMRETMDEVVANHLEKLKQLSHERGVEWRYNVNDATFTFPQFTQGIMPSQIFLGYGKHLDHVRRYMGNPYLDVLWDEATNFPKEVVTLVNGSLANEFWPETVSKSMYTCNPGGVGAAWVLEDFVTDATRVPHSVFIQAFVDDNPTFLASDPDFKQHLLEEYADQPWVIEQWLYGNWFASPSSFFAFDARPGGKHVREVAVPYWAKWYFMADAGYYPFPFAGVWAARWQDENGRLHMHCVADLKRFRLEVDEQAEAVRDLEKSNPNLRHADPRMRRFACWSTGQKVPTESAEVTKTVSRMWRKHGLVTTPARKWGRVDGWMLIRYLLKHQELTVDPGCRALIAELRDAQHEKAPGGAVGQDLDDRTGDDCLDCLRGICCEVIGLRHMRQRRGPWDAEELARPQPVRRRQRRENELAEVEREREREAA